jgi:alpha-beta hydrolase superfamily lysophospholipase
MPRTRAENRFPRPLALQPVAGNAQRYAGIELADTLRADSMLLDHPLISERYFFPRPDAVAAPFLVSAAGVDLHCFCDRCRPGAKTFLHFHGNGEVVADYVPDYTDAIAAMGVNVCMVEYRGYGGSGGVPGLARMLDDGEDVLRAVAVPDSDIVVYGRSVGALYAVELASRHPGVAALILESGIADLLERLRIRVSPAELGVTDAELAAAVAERFDHEKKLARFRGPLLVMHARDDDVVHVSHARRNHAWAGGDDKDLVLFDFGGHNALMSANWPRYLETLRRFLARVG